MTLLIKTVSCNAFRRRIELSPTKVDDYTHQKKRGYSTISKVDADGSWHHVVGGVHRIVSKESTSELPVPPKRSSQKSGITVNFEERSMRLCSESDMLCEHLTRPKKVKGAQCW
jgi:hypothetical protein